MDYVVFLMQACSVPCYLSPDTGDGTLFVTRPGGMWGCMSWLGWLVMYGNGSPVMWQPAWHGATAIKTNILK